MTNILPVVPLPGEGPVALAAIAARDDIIATRGFPTRAALVLAVSLGLAVAAGTVANADGLAYVRDPSAAMIPDLPGWRPVDATLRHFGAVGSVQVVDDAPRVRDALASGLILRGEGRIYGVTGTIDLPSGTYLTDATFRRLDATTVTDISVLRAINRDRIRLMRVRVDRNGTGANIGDNQPPNARLGSYMALRISGGRYHHLEDLEVFGNDSGTGLQFDNLDHTTTLVRPYARDMIAQVPFQATESEDEESPSGALINDCAQGMRFQNNDNLVVQQPRFERIGWRPDADTPPVYLHTRGIAASGNVRLTLLAPNGEDVGQGIDFSGALRTGNRHCRVFHGIVRRCGYQAYKVANWCMGMLMQGCVAIDCVRAGFVESSNWDDPVGQEYANYYRQCVAIRCGRQQGSSAAFIKVPGSRQFSGIMDVADCVAMDDRPNPEDRMKWGFRNEVASRADAQQRLRDFLSVGHTISSSEGWDNAQLALASTASQTIVTSYAGDPEVATPTYVRGTAVALPPGSRFDGAVYRAIIWIEKGAVGTASPRVRVHYGAAAVTAPVLADVQFSNQTAVADRGRIEVTVTLRGSDNLGQAQIVVEMWKWAAGSDGFGPQAYQHRRATTLTVEPQGIARFLSVSIDPGRTNGVPTQWTAFSSFARLELLGGGGGG
jgi:hypothetical protein